MRRAKKKKVRLAKMRQSGRRLRIESLEARAMLHGTGVLSGSVFLDADDDGTRDAGETGVPGVVVRLSDSNSTDSTTDQSTITDDDGIYSFGELEPGTYQISKRQTPATVGGQESTSVPNAVSSKNRITEIVLADDQNLGGNHFAEQGLRAEFVGIRWYFASTPPVQEMLRETIALGEQLAGNTELAASVRTGGLRDGDLDDSNAGNNAPIATADAYAADLNTVLTVNATSGVLANDIDLDGTSLLATLVGQASSGLATLNTDGSFTYTPDADFIGVDTFSYQVSDGSATSRLATVTINVSRSGQEPVATNDQYTVAEDGVLTVTEASGLLSNDINPGDSVLTAELIDSPANGSVTLTQDGSFTYNPDNGFSGSDSFTYRADNGTFTSNLGTVTIAVTANDVNVPFGTVIPGSFTDPNVLGVRTDLVPGAPAISASHQEGTIDYSAYSNPPTYGNHHGFDSQGTDANPGITPRPTGVYTTEQPDEDLLHNLEHGHVWISYNPNLIDSNDLVALVQFVRDGAQDPNGAGVGVILTPRAANDNMIALASWTRLQTLDSYDPAAIRSFVESNRGKSPEGFITP